MRNFLRYCVVTRLCVLLFTIALVTSCASERRQRLAPADALESQREALTKIARGMSEKEVRLKLGNPSEVRFEKFSVLGGEAYRWAYGARTAGGFANIGLVMFSPDKTVLGTSCPTKQTYFRRLALATPVTRAPQRTISGRYCVIESVRAPEPDSKRISPLPYTLATLLRFSIVNEGTDPFLFSQPTAWIKFNLIIEVFDSEMSLVLRQDYDHYASPYSPDRNEWPMVRIPPGRRESEEFPIWLTDLRYGKPASGKYFVRLLFPFEPDHFYSSNLMEFSVQ
jgi:hypothetical protein